MSVNANIEITNDDSNEALQRLQVLRYKKEQTVLSWDDEGQLGLDAMTIDGDLGHDFLMTDESPEENNLKAEFAQTAEQRNRELKMCMLGDPECEACQ